MLRITFLLLVGFLSAQSFSISDINNLVSKTKKYADEYESKYGKKKTYYEEKKEEYFPEEYKEDKNIKILKNNTLLKKKVFAKLKCDDTYGNQVVDTCYSFRKKGALAVAYTVDKKIVHAINLKKRGKWHYNKNIPTYYRSSNSDYLRSGYDKGHCAFDSAFDVTQRVLNNTYDLNINAVPMAAMVNRKTWIQAEYFTKKVAVSLGKVDVIDIMVYDKHPKRIGKNRISVPRGFYKVLENKKAGFLECYYYENDLNVKWKRDKLEDHLVNCSSIF